LPLKRRHFVPRRCAETGPPSLCQTPFPKSRLPGVNPASRSSSRPGEYGQEVQRNRRTTEAGFGRSATRIYSPASKSNPANLDSRDEKGEHPALYDPPVFTVLIRRWTKTRVPRREVAVSPYRPGPGFLCCSIRVGVLGAHMMIVSRILCFVGIVVLAFVIFRKPREIVITDPPAEKSQVSLPQPPSTARPRPRTRPRPMPQPADAATFEPESQQPVYR
jgi:hypothetical protein